MYNSSIQSARSSIRHATFLPVAVALMLITGCSVFGGASVEETPYQLIRKDKQFEVRDYPSVIVVQTQVTVSPGENAGNEAFGRLFNYISGENEVSEKIAMTVPVTSSTNDSSSSKKIAMTAPVTYQKQGDSWRYRFVLPEGFTITSAPQPLNPDVSIAQTAPRRVATVTYSGLGRNKARIENTEALLAWIAVQGLEALSEPRWAGFNPPWTLPPFRRNEVMVDVAVK